ncbi:DNA helicase [Chrysochromulina tobinii]|uniref:DNA helicase n=1 Tax=Chrysochromulina tobinii TaxID=1460289 RepID=A0A0M0JD90_9EUKA|nr:DNA helicase [Chrysochromulina tobinii]|eukprot:KOO24337.1 DNA helicase [Chrysochromulina sp. CCMP291]
MRFASEVIYSGQLRSGLPPSARPPVRGFAWPSAVVPIAFIEVDAHEQIEHDSKLNRLEAERLMALLEMVLVAGDVSTAEVGVVTPYTAQRGASASSETGAGSTCSSPVHGAG